MGKHHIVLTGGVHNAVNNALEVNADSFAFFLKSGRQWKAKPLEQDVIDKFKVAVKVRLTTHYTMIQHNFISI